MNSEETTEEYHNYSDEPEEVFHPLPEELGCELYDLEMSTFTEDLYFYDMFVPRRGLFLELGCGSGRIIRTLASPSRQCIGIDVSHTMVKRALLKPTRHARFICMDMTAMAFSVTFDAIIIGYNTLNLLVHHEAILSCLQRCRQLLRPGGQLLLQLYIPTRMFRESPKKTFQFQMLDNPQGGKVIKEILKNYNPEKRQTHIEERFRVRPMSEGRTNKDWRTSYSIAGFSLEYWSALFNESGFSFAEYFGDYDLSPFTSEKSSIFLATLI